MVFSSSTFHSHTLRGSGDCENFARTTHCIIIMIIVMIIIIVIIIMIIITCNTLDTYHMQHVMRHMVQRDGSAVN